LPFRRLGVFAFAYLHICLLPFGRLGV